jgi:hypothetical protein
MISPPTHARTGGWRAAAVHREEEKRRFISVH